jgi:hypothetical protein
VRRAALLIAERFAAWGDLPHVVRDVFPDPTPDAIAAALDAYCRRALGAPIDATEFTAAGVGSVHGLRLADGRRVVVKVHPRRSSPGHLEAMQAVQRELAAAGFPAPEPLAAAEPLGHGIAVTETLLDSGGRADAHDPAIRRAMATALARLVALCRPLTGLSGLREHLMAIRPGELWPVPHDGRFDFEATAAGAEWIDRIAARARRARDREVGDVVVGHTDWRVENMRFAGGAVSAVYDWDSLAAQREPVLAGGVAHLFTSDFTAGPEWIQLPTLGEALAFVADYEAARAVRRRRARGRPRRAAVRDGLHRALRALGRAHRLRRPAPAPAGGGSGARAGQRTGVHRGARRCAARNRAGQPMSSPLRIRLTSEQTTGGHHDHRDRFRPHPDRRRLAPPPARPGRREPRRVPAFGAPDAPPLGLTPQRPAGPRAPRSARARGAIIRSLFTAPDGDQARRRLRDAVEQLERRLPKVAALLEEAAADVLAFYDRAACSARPL